MSSFFRGGRHFLQASQQILRRAPNGQRRLLASSSASSSTFTLTFTAPQFVLQNSQQSHVNTTTGPVRNQSTVATTSCSSGGCGSATCCQTMSALTCGDDAEDPFIGAPPLSSSLNNNSSRMVRGEASSSDHASMQSSTQPNASTPPSSTPPPRTKCDPYEQGGHPLSPTIVNQHRMATLDSGWSYDETKRILVREFDFGAEFRLPVLPRNEDAKQMFEFVHSLGNMQVFGSHLIYNMNLNLRANRLQVMLKTVPLQGISFQDLMLATKIDGVWFRLMKQKRAMINKIEGQVKEQATPLKLTNEQKEALDEALEYSRTSPY